MLQDHLSAGRVKTKALKSALIAKLPQVCVCRSGEVELLPASHCTSTEKKTPQNLKGRNRAATKQWWCLRLIPAWRRGRWFGW